MHKRTLFKNSDWLLLRAIIAISAGILLFIKPDLLAQSVILGVGVLFILFGIAFLLISGRKNQRSTVFYFVASGSIAAITSGVILIIASDFFARFFIFIVGLSVVILSVVQFFEVFNMRKLTPPLSVFAYLNPLLLTGFGVLIMLNPSGIHNLIGYLASFALVYYGIAGCFFAFKIRKALKSLLKTEVGVSTDSIKANQEETDKSTLHE